jgi:hypothetical protein
VLALSGKHGQAISVWGIPEIDATRDAVGVYIVTIGIPTSTFRGHLDAIEGARLVRQLSPGRVVVALRSPADRPRLAALPGVEAVVPDRLEHPDRSA